MVTGLRVLIALAVITGAVCVAEAQTPARPFRGLFGGAQPLTSRAESLSLTLSGFGAYDEPTPVDPTTSADDRVNVNGPYGGTTAVLDFTYPGKRLNFLGTASGFAGYFPDNSESPWYTSSSAASNLSYEVPLSPRNRFRLGEAALFGTDVRLGLISGTPGSGVPLAGGNSSFDNSLQRDPFIDSRSTVAYEHSFSQVSSVTALYGFGLYHFLNSDSQRSDHQQQQAGVNYTHGLGKYASLVLGYTYRRDVVPGGVELPNEMHDINAGVNYSRSLSLTRKTTFSFHTGSTVTNVSSASGGTTAPGTHFFVVGGALLTREIGRTWAAQASYDRSVTYDAGFAQPILLDQASAGIGGLIGRTVDVSSGVYYSIGAIGLGDTNYHSWLESSQIRWAITQNLAAYASYYFYLYNFGNSVALPTGVVQELHRSGVRVGLTTWLPFWTGRGAP